MLFYFLGFFWVIFSYKNATKLKKKTKKTEGKKILNKIPLKKKKMKTETCWRIGKTTHLDHGEKIRKKMWLAGIYSVSIWQINHISLKHTELLNIKGWNKKNKIKKKLLHKTFKKTL